MVKTRGLKKNLAADRQGRSERRTKARNEDPAQRLDVVVWEPTPLPVSHSEPSPSEGASQKRRRLVRDGEPVSSSAVLPEEAVAEVASGEEQAAEAAVAVSAEEECRSLVMSPGIIGEGVETGAESPEQEPATAHPPSSNKGKAPILIPVTSSEGSSSEEEEEGSLGGPSERGPAAEDLSALTVGGTWFRNKSVSQTWNVVERKHIVHEKRLVQDKYRSAAMIQLLTEVNLLKSLTFPHRFNITLVREFIVNMEEKFGEEGAGEYGKSWVRGKSVVITPEIIDAFLGIHENARAPTDVKPEFLAKILTGGVCLSWGGPNLSAAELTSKYALLYHLGVRNWIPSSHRGKVNKDFANLLYSIGKRRKISLGSVMFPQLATHAGSASSSKPIVLPSLIHGIMVSQHPEFGAITEGLSEELQVFTVDHKLFKGKHAVDVAYEDLLMVGSSAPAPMEESLPPAATIQSALRARIVSHLRSELAILEAEAKRRDARRGQIRSLLRDLEFPADDEQAP